MPLVYQNGSSLEGSTTLGLVIRYERFSPCPRHQNLILSFFCVSPALPHQCVTRCNRALRFYLYGLQPPARNQRGELPRCDLAFTGQSDHVRARGLGKENPIREGFLSDTRNLSWDIPYNGFICFRHCLRVPHPAVTRSHSESIKL